MKNMHNILLFLLTVYETEWYHRETDEIYES